MIHRDVKPANLLLDEDGVLKVTDFGIACLAGRSHPAARGGAVVGTPVYMAPELLLDGEVDTRSDLYSLGVVMYECLTGRLPFDADSPLALMVKLLEEKVQPPLALNRDVPPALSALVVRLIALRPDERLSTAAELADQLGRISSAPAWPSRSLEVAAR